MLQPRLILQTLGVARAQVLEQIVRSLSKGRTHEATVSAGYVECIDQVIEFIAKDADDGDEE